ncbi:EpsG family protein [uncultured Anaerococcus sp.]|uniref:EpsG family protein n=1 Tax=uncultured Anaerococcus sp. TaxID=293428 RepID=UPI0026033E37|nr:EpsG family protein [uncultured Anaerococcus sp.]
MGFLLFTSIELLLFAINSSIDFKKKQQSNIAAGLMFLIMFVFAATRGSGDADYYNYLWFVKHLDKDYWRLFDFTYPVEFAFRFFALGINFLGLSRQWVIVIMNICSILPIAYVTIKESDNPFLSAIVFLPIFIQFDMQTSRTASAIGLGFLSSYFLVKKHYGRAIFFFAFACAFHKSAMIILPFLIVSRFRLGNAIKTISLALAFGVSLFSMVVFNIVGAITSAVGLGVISSKLNTYVFSGGIFAFPMKIYDPRILFGLFLFILSVMYFSKYSFDKNSMMEVSCKAIWFGLIVFLVFRSSTAIAFRFGNFFAIYQVIFVPRLMKEARKIDKLAYFLLILSIIFFILPYAGFLMAKAPAYDFFFTNKSAIHSLS